MSDQGDLHHGSDGGGALTPEAAAILRRGIDQLLLLAEAYEPRPLPSEKFPFPLTCVAYGVSDRSGACGPLDSSPPGAQTVRDDIEAGLGSDPLSVLENLLALLEVYEANQPDIAAHFLEDMPFLATCFSSKRCNGWIAVIGDGDRAEVEAAVNARWQFKFFSGPARPTGIYVLLSMLVRYAYVYGGVEFGDPHGLSHFVEDHCPGLIVCRGRMSDLELTLSLAAMKMGVPAIVPSDYPFPLGRMIRADRLEDVADAVVAFANIRRLIHTPDIPQLPSYCDSQNANQEVVPEVTWGATPESFLIVRRGSVSSPGFRVIGTPGRDIGVVVTIDAQPMDGFDRDYLEQAIVPKLRTMAGVGTRLTETEFCIQQARNVHLDPARVGEVLAAAVGNLLPKLRDKVLVEVIFDPQRLKMLAPRVRLEKEGRRRDIESATEETTDWFIGCTGCSPFAPDHVCIVTPQRPPQCGRSLGMLKVGALYSYDDMTNIHHTRLQRDVNSFAVIDKGRCLDPTRGEWSGVNAHVSRMSQGRTNRVFLHCLDDHPHTGCGCFQVILFKTDKPSPGIGIMERGYIGRCPDGRTWKDLHYQLAGKQAPGLAGAVPEYLLSAKFLLAHGGWASVVWVSPKIGAFMGSRL